MANLHGPNEGLFLRTANSVTGTALGCVLGAAVLFAALSIGGAVVWVVLALLGVAN